MFAGAAFALIFGMIGVRIRSARRKEGLSQKALGARVGVSGAAVSQWETGDTKDLRLEHFFRLADVLGLSPRELFTGEHAPSDVRRLVDAYVSADDQYLAILLMVANASPEMRRDIARALVDSMVRSDRPRHQMAIQ